MSITICHGSILDSKAEYIVNPANSFLRHDGGLAKVIADAATRPFEPDDFPRADVKTLRAARDAEWDKVNAWRDDHGRVGLLATGNAYMTHAGRLPFKGVVHAVGPIWNGGDFLEQDLLELAYENAGLVACHAGAQSIAFPAISAGVFGMPIEIVAKVAVEVCSWLPEDVRCELWAFSDEHYEAFRAEAGV